MSHSLRRFPSFSSSSTSDKSTRSSMSEFHAPPSRRGFRPSNLPSPVAVPLLQTSPLSNLEIAGKTLPQYSDMGLPVPGTAPAQRKGGFSFFKSKSSRPTSTPTSQRAQDLPPLLRVSSPSVASITSSNSASSNLRSASAPTLAPAVPAATMPLRPTTFAHFAKRTGPRALVMRRRKLSSRSPPESLPESWEEYEHWYASNEMDIEDPPLPPSREAVEAAVGMAIPPTPFDERVWVAPMPSNEAHRQAVVAKLDLFGTRLATPFNNSFPDSLEHHPAFLAVVQKCQQAFGSAAAMLTILDDEQQHFLAMEGMQTGIELLPRGASFCSHTILNADCGLVVLDAQNDWRFANNVPSAVLGVRFYAGVPFFAPTFGDPNAALVTLGTLCIMDDRPHDHFSIEERDQLRHLAAEATLEVEGWFNARTFTNKVDRLESMLNDAKLADSSPALPTEALPPRARTSSSPGPSPRGPLPALPPADISLFPDTPPLSTSGSHPTFAPMTEKERSFSPPATPPHSPDASAFQLGARRGSGRSISSATSASSFSLTPSAAPTSPTYHHLPPSPALLPLPLHPRPRRSLALPTTSSSPLSPTTRDVQKAFDTATRLLSKSLSLSLVYLVALDLSSSLHTLTLLSSSGLPNPAPSFEPELHFRALRAPEGGLLYRKARGSVGGYAGGLLVPVTEVRGVGYVLSGYTEEEGRGFGEREMGYFVKVAEQLEVWVGRVGTITEGY